ncbi:MAG TPA: hypothetical protein VFW40_14160, partial [Capsulimonadaceae bacterium]|nr:hypothetical protein [Capsulimonadaceae bacterium]
MFAIHRSKTLGWSLALASLIVFSTALLCRADDASISGVGGAVEMIGQHPTIRMVEERVSITNPKFPHVTASFVFHNDGRATTVLIGFPERAYGAGADKQGAGLANFQSLVDGKPIRVTERPDSGNVADSGDYEGWLVKKVHFGAHQTHVITDTYDGGGGEEAMGSQFFVYVLKSGASWKGPIGRAVISADLSSLAGYSPLLIEPAGYKIVGHKVIWDLRNFKPKDDIEVTWFPAFLDVDVNGQYPYSGMDHRVR